MSNRTFLKRVVVAAVLALSSLAAAQAPANDLCTNAEVIPATGAFPKLSSVVNLTGATSDPASPISCQGNNNSSVWYSFTPTTTGVYTIQNCTPAGNTLSDTALSVYTACGSATETGCNDDGCSLRSTVTTTLTSGVTYFVQVAKYGTTAPAATDTMQIQIEQVVRPENDTCGGRVPALVLNAPLGFASNQITTNDSQPGGSLDGGAGTCFTGVGHSTTATANLSAGRDLSFSFTPPNTGTYSFRVSAPSSSISTTLYLSDSCVDALTPPQTYTPPQCIAAANRQGTFTTGAEEIVCVPLTAGVQVFAHADEATALSTGGQTMEIEVNACTLEAAGNDAPATAGALACPVTGSTAPAADVDFFALGTRTSTAKVYAMVDGYSSGSAGSSNTGYDLRVTSDTATLEYDNSDLDTPFGSSAPSIAGTTLPANAAAYLRVNQNSATAVTEPYRLYSVIQTGTPTVEAEPNDTLATAGGHPGNYFSGDVTSTTDVDVFAFEARAGDLAFISLDTEPTRAATGSTANLGMQLLNASGTALVTTADFTTTITNTIAVTPALNSTTPTVPSEGLVYRVRTAGVYYVRVNRVSTTGASAYQLSIALNCGAGGGIGAPGLTSLTPGTGSVVGGTTITLTGTGFGASSAVKIGGNPATVTNRTSSTLEVTTPAGNVGAVDVVVTNPGGQTATLTGGFTYFEPIIPPTITSLTPATGPTAGGTVVTIAGTIFKAGAVVSFTVGGVTVPATNVAVQSAIRMTCTMPAHAPGLAAITVNNPADNLPTTQADVFTYLAPPAITAVTPNTGLTTGGQTITLSGSAFRTGAIVRFGTVAGTAVTVDPSGTSLTVTSPVAALSGAVDVTVLNTDTQQVVSTGAFTYSYPAPTLASVTPASGYEVGGTTITLIGTGFIAAPTVTVGGVAATGINRVSSTEVRAVTPAGTGVVAVTLTNSDAQAITRPAAFTYVPAPTLTAVAPSHGQVQGGTRITLAGTNFKQGASIFIGGVPVFAVQVTSDTSATAVTNVGAPGLADVRFTNPDLQSATLTAAFNYDAAPTLTALSPISGSTAGGTTVTLTGSGFLAGAAVVFGTSEATTVTVVSPTQLTAVTPARAIGVVSVVVRNTDSQSAELLRAYRFVAPPTLTTAAPSTGDVTGGTVVRLTGSGFSAGTTVTVGGTAAQQVTLVSGTELDVVTPAHAPGATDIVVSTDGATATLTGGFTYTRGAPTLSAAAPVSGPIAGGTLLTLTGTGFAAGASVTIGGVAGTNLVIVSGELARVVVPAHAAGAVDVVLTNDDAQKATLAGGYTYVAPPSSAVGTLTDGGSGAVGADPTPVDNNPGGVSCGCTSFDGSVLSLGGMGLLLVLSRRRRQ